MNIAVQAWQNTEHKSLSFPEVYAEYMCRNRIVGSLNVTSSQ